MNHNEIVQRTAKWLKRHHANIVVPNCPTVVTELTTATMTGEIPDVIGFNSHSSVLCEVKTSRSDFLRDKKKVFRHNPEMGMGEYRYYVCPHGLIKEMDLPKDWGLLYVKRKKIEIIKKSERHECNHRSERTLLLSVIRRQKVSACA